MGDNKPSRFNAFKYDADDENLVIIGLDTEDGPDHELYDERVNLPLDEAMLANIMALGVKEPILVRKTPGKGEKTYQVVDGRRRLIHAREAHKRLLKQGEPGVKVPVIIESGSDEHVATLAVSMNEIRKDDDVLVKAQKAERLMSRLGDKKAVANAFGVTTVTLDNWRKLMELSAPVKKAVASGQLSAHAASKLHGMTPEEQKAELDKVKTAVADNGGKRATARQVENGGKKPARKVSRKQLEALAKRLKDASDERGIGILAGIQFALGKNTKPFKEYMKEFEALEAEEQASDEAAA